MCEEGVTNFLRVLSWDFFQLEKKTEIERVIAIENNGFKKWGWIETDPSRVNNNLDCAWECNMRSYFNYSLHHTHTHSHTLSLSVAYFFLILSLSLLQHTIVKAFDNNKRKREGRSMHCFICELRGPLRRDPSIWPPRWSSWERGRWVLSFVANKNYFCKSYGQTQAMGEIWTKFLYFFRVAREKKDFGTFFHYFLKAKKMGSQWSSRQG